MGTVSTMDVDPDQKAIAENPLAEDSIDIVQQYKSQRNQSRINVSS
jgi:hypothetical protein